jgi:hypothetical protein
MENQIERIKNKLANLKQLDSDKMLFGASTHKYLLNSTLADNEIHDFELRHTIQLPQDYILFLTKIGNGGAGPFYGLEPLKNGLFNDLDYPDTEDLLNPSKPFPYIEPWNITFTHTIAEHGDQEEFDKEFEEFSNQYFDSNIINGALNICNFGCAVTILLVVNGPERGFIWTDDRASDKGIYPYKKNGKSNKISFLDWYECWLDDSISEIKNLNNGKDVSLKIDKRWWKFW